MSDLIWIGNTLYPRWIVVLAIGLTFAIVVGVLTATGWAYGQATR